MSFKSKFNIHILCDIQRIGDEGYRGVQDLISDMILKRTLFTSGGWGIGQEGGTRPDI